MPRPRRTAREAAAALAARQLTARARREILPGAVYSEHEAYRALRLSRTAFLAEVAAGRIRSREVSGRRRYLGSWLLDWMEG